MKVFFSLAGHIGEETFHDLGSSSAKSSIVVIAILSICVPAIASIGHDNNEIGPTQQAFDIGTFEPAILIS